MTTPARSAAQQRGMSLVEVTIFLAIAAPLMIALGAAVGVFARSTTAGHHRATADSENQKIVRKIAGELTQASTQIDHAMPASVLRPQPESFTPGATNAAYDRANGGALHPLDHLHDNLERDGAEEWHTVDPQRRFYIYATFAPFDTIEYQRVHTPGNMSHINMGSGTVEQPWSNRRKVYLDADGTVKLRVEEGAGVRTMVLGTHVKELKFHINADGQIVVRLTTESGGAGGEDRDKARFVSQVAVTPRNGLSQL